MYVVIYGSFISPACIFIFFFSSEMLAKLSYSVNPRLNKVYVCMYVCMYVCVRHLFVDCDFSKVFWIDFTSWWNCKNNTQIVLQPRNILFAFNPGKQSFLGVNYCLLVARNYIYISAKNEDPFCFNSYLAFLKNELGTDKRKIRDLVTL